MTFSFGRLVAALVLVFACQARWAAGQNTTSPSSTALPSRAQQDPQAPPASAAMPAGPVQAPAPPFPALSPPMQTYIDQLLEYWEGSSSQIRLYLCDFTRWEYDPQMCNWRNPANNRLAAKTISKGKIRFANPDKGMYEVTEKWHFAGPPEADQTEPKYAMGENEVEKWICDGTYIYEFDYLNKKLYDLKLPPEAQGEGLKNSPLPFVFGAKAADLKERFWIRDVTPAGVQDQYWLEAWPKRIEDAQVYQKVEIILSRDPFLPESIHIYSPNYDDKRNPVKIVFVFENRKINGTLQMVSNFLGYFVRPSKPFGWDRVERKMSAREQAPMTGQVPAGPTR